MGILYDHSILALVIFGVALQATGNEVGTSRQTISLVHMADATLHANGKPMSNRMQDNFKMLNTKHKVFKRQVERRSGRGPC